MASDSDDSESSLESLSEEESTQFGLQPYLFEPQAKDYSQDDSEEGIPEEAVDDIIPDDARLENTDWCQCGACDLMPTVRECICCKEYQELRDKVAIYNENHDGSVECITSHPGFYDVCLSIWSLEASFYQYRQQYGQINGPLNERYRYVAYRQLVRWCWGWLGQKNRVVLPACAVQKIRDRFPPTAGITGFLPPLV